MAIVLLFAHSPLPWWILGPAAIALVAGFTYLFKNTLHKRGETKDSELIPLPAHSTRHYHRPWIGSFGKTANSNYPSFLLKT